MNRNQIIPAVMVALLILIPFVFYLVTDLDQKGEEQSNEDQSEQNDDNSNSEDQPDIIWGVDSASYTSEDMYQCVRDNFGEPRVWGRYLGTIEDVSAGITVEEVDYLHERDVRVLVIYNHFSDATGYDHGVEEAENAISMAEQLEIPGGVAIFGDIEPSYPVDSNFIQGWYDTFNSSAYESGLYGVYNQDSDLIESYHAINEEAQENTVVWTAYPQSEITSQNNAPEFDPQGPENSLVYGWQYAIDAESCNIDTNLFQNDILEYLW